MSFTPNPPPPRRRVLRAGHLLGAVVAVLGVMAIGAPLAGAAVPGQPFVSGVTFPFNGVWLDSTDGGHYWDASGNGLCRIDPDPANPGTFKFSVYINGALAGEKTTLQPSVPGNLFPEPVHIGADSGGGSLFTGVIDEPRIWNRALTADEIATLVFQSTNCQ